MSQHSVADASAARAATRRQAAADRRANRQGGAPAVGGTSPSEPTGPPGSEGNPLVAPEVPSLSDPTPLVVNPLSPEETERQTRLNAIINKTPEVQAELDALDARGVGISETDAGAGLVGATETQAADTFASEETQRDRAEDLSDEIQGDITDTEDRIDEVTDILDTNKADLDGQIQTALAAVEAIPGQVMTEFERLRKEFGTVSAEALADIDAKAEKALGDVMEGRSEAMQAAVQGIQGNINTAIAKIQSNPNLTAGQKASMIAQTQLAGASSLAPAIGANILAFNQLQANVATTFGGFTATLRGQIIGEEGAFGRAQGTAFADATVASQNISAMLLGTQASSDEAYGTAMANLEGTRSMAQMTGNQLLLNNLPNLQDPVLNGIDTAATTLLLATDLAQREWDRIIAEFGRDFALSMAKWEIGTAWSRLVDATVEGGLEAGAPGAALGAAGQVLSEGNNPAPVIA